MSAVGEGHMITFAINGTAVHGTSGESLLLAIRRAGHRVPSLCYHQAVAPYGACRLCLVEVGKGKKRRLTTSCNYPVQEGIEVSLDTDMVLEHRRTVLELLLAMAPDSRILGEIAANYGVVDTPFERAPEGECILCGLCSRVCAERMGVGAVDFSGRGGGRKIGPAYDKRSPVCIACGACETVCPMGIEVAHSISARDIRPSLAKFDAGLVSRPSIYIPFQQAIPKTPVVDRETCAHFVTGKCGVCKEFCEAGAIDFEQKDEVVELDVGSVIIAPGFELFDHHQRSQYGFGQFPNVITSIALERVLSASGPFHGHLERPWDGKVPKRIAFFQCIGSREDEADYCSSVCCMYAVKHSLMAKEHDPELDCAIFFMDMRAFGKGFDAYYQRAIDAGVRFVRTRPAAVEEAGEDRHLSVRYQDESGTFKSEEFDLVVLSSGIRPSIAGGELAGRLGVELDERGYCRTERLAPLETSRSGVFVCGPFGEPRDIPETVMQASGAAGRAMALLADARGTLVRPRAYPDEIDVRGQDPRIGVFVCHCGRNIGSVVNVPEVVEYAKTLPDVVYAQENVFTCSQDTQDQIKQQIRELGLNRVIVASCTPRTHEPLFRDTIRDAGLNRHLFEMANIRDQCSWVHMHAPAESTRKAKDLVRMAVAKSRLLEPLEEKTMGLNHGALVIGGGVAGMTAALAIADQGFDVHLVERSCELGGHARHVRSLPEGGSPQALLHDLFRRTIGHPRISVYLGTSVQAVNGFVGNFKTTLGANGSAVEVEHGVVVVATGADELKPTEYLYGEDPRVVTQVELEAEIDTGNANAKTVVMIQCVGSRDAEHPYCSRLCCAHAIRNALKMKELRPETDIFVLYRDVRTYGFRESLYTRARKAGIRFIRYEPERKPEVARHEERLRVTVYDPILQVQLAIDCDKVALSAAVVPLATSQDLGKLLKVPLNQDKYFLEAHLKLRPVEFATDGVFLCGLAHSPKGLDETLAQASATAARAATILSKESMPLEAAISHVVDANCDGCAYCIDPCPYKALTLIEYMRNGEIKKTVETNEALCKGCGVCQGTCPKQGIYIRNFRLDQLGAMVQAALEPIP